jgi:hypothetical protein
MLLNYLISFSLVILRNVSNLDKSILNPTKLKNQFPVTRYTRDVEEKEILLQAFFKSVQQYQLLLNRRLEIVAFND